MHPELSLVFMTLISGIGQGLFLITFLLSLLFPGAITFQYHIVSVIISILFQYVGGGASIFHLGNPQRAYKAIKQWKHSWLSREALTLGAFTGLIHLYAIALYMNHSGGMNISSTIIYIIGGLTVLFSIGFFISSAMLYAVIRFIKEWSNAYTPLNFFFSGIVSGGAIALCLTYIFKIQNAKMAEWLVTYLIITTVAFFIIKLLTFWFYHNHYMPITLKSALGINGENLRLMDFGTQFDHYNTKEFYSHTNESGIKLQENLITFISFLLPIGAWIAINQGVIPSGILTIAAIATTIIMILGLIIDRRLFFLVGNHLQNHYYGNFRYNKVSNPLLIPARKGTPGSIK